jgi:hypothetical protein
VLVVVHQTYSWPEAEALTNMLSAYGLEAVLADRNTIGNNWHETIAFGGFRVMVPEMHMRHASIFVDEFKAAGEKNGSPESDAFREKPVENTFWLMVSLLGVWFPAWLRRRKR